jgi:hypothetical protein
MGTPTIRRGLRWLPIGALVSSALSIGTAATAQQVDPQALGPAQAIFDSAEQLMAAHRYEDACPRLEEVVRLVPVGVGARMTLARCYEQAGRLASAWAAYLVAANAATVAGQADRARTATERAAALKPRLSALVISVPERLRDLEGLEIKRDGKVLSHTEWGLAVPLDAGTYAITATAPARKPWQAAAEVKGDATVTSIALPEKLEDVPAVVPPRSARETAPTPPPLDAGAGVKGGVPAWAWAVGGAGVALVGVSLGFLIDERLAQANIDTHCPGGQACLVGFDASGANARLDRDLGVFVGVGVLGLLAVGAAITGIATAPQRPKVAARPLPRPWVGAGAAGLAWEGRF